MADDDTERPSLEAPSLFRRRRASPRPEPGPTGSTAAAAPVARTVEDRVFEDSGRDVTRPLPAQPAIAAQPDGDAASDDSGPGRRRARPALPSRPSMPSVAALAGRAAAALTGAVVGLTLVVLTWLGFRGCELVRGTSSCGAAPGMAALVVILALAVVVGGVLLSRAGVPDPGATSFLGTGLTGILCLVFLVDHLGTWPMVLVIPALTAATFVVAWWVTTREVEPA